MKNLLPLFAFLLALTGCVSPARQLDPELIGRIQEGTTTRGEVEQIFGKPKGTQTGANQKTLACYEFQQARKHPGWVGAFKAEAGSIFYRTLTVLYAGEVVEKCLYGQSNTAVKFERTGISAGHNVTDESLRNISKGITSRGELIQWFGPPTMQTLNLNGDRILCWFYVEKTGRTRDDQKRDFRAAVDDDDFVNDFNVVGLSGWNIEPFR